MSDYNGYYAHQPSNGHIPAVAVAAAPSYAPYQEEYAPPPVPKPPVRVRGKGKRKLEEAAKASKDALARLNDPSDNRGFPQGDGEDDEDPSLTGDNIIRSGRACLACRKLKTRCDGANDPPCTRCRTGNHECIFVESKRGKRPARKPTDMTLGEKFRSVEKSLATMLAAVNAGGAPDAALLSSIQNTIAEGVASTASKVAKANAAKLVAQQQQSAPGGSSAGMPSHHSQYLDSSPGSSGAGGEGLSDAGGADAAYHHERRDSTASYKRPRMHQANSARSASESTGGGGRPLATSHSYESPLLNTMPPRMLHPDPHTLAAPAPSTGLSSTISIAGSSSLSLLAEASLAAEIDGRTQLTGLDPSFRLSTVTALLQAEGVPTVSTDDKTPGLLSLGIVDAQTAVELFRIFFDYAYIHLPLLDPAHNTATAVCARSPFLFTVICAVASRFHADPTLHVKCYDEAHACFVECVANSERNIEMVQACLILTVWTNAPKNTEDRPQRAWLYFGMAVRMGLELGLFRPPAFVDDHLVMNSNKSNPWANLKHVPEDEQREALNRERTWLMVFVIDRNMSAVMGRPYQIHEAKPLLIPLHPMSLPFDLGIIAHQELQSIIGQVMDTFRDRIYGLSSASDEMPSPVVLKLFNSRMDEWRQRWCPVAGEPIANNLLFYFYSSKLFLNTFPLHTMLRNGDAVDDPACVSTTINSAKAILDLGHKYAELGVLRHCPDVNFLLLLYAAVFLIKVKASNSRFAQLVDSEDLQEALLQSIADCNAATCSSKHAASTCMIMLRALFASWKAMSTQTTTLATAGGISRAGMSAHHSRKPSNAGMPGVHPNHPHEMDSNSLHGMASDGSSDPFASMVGDAFHPYHQHATTSFNAFSKPGSMSGTNTGSHTPSTFHQHLAASDPLDSFLSDTQFFNSVLVSQGADGFFSWSEGLDSAAGMDKDFNTWPAEKIAAD